MPTSLNIYYLIMGRKWEEVELIIQGKLFKLFSNHFQTIFKPFEIDRNRGRFTRSHAA